MKLDCFVLVAYDIQNTRARTKVANCLKDYGFRVQFSVFECLLTKDKYESLKEKLAGWIDTEKDSIRFYKLCLQCQHQLHIEGIGEQLKETDCWIL